MNALLISQLVLQLGPVALQLAQDLSNVWNTPNLTPEQVTAICGKAQKSYDSYIADAKAATAALKPS